MNFKDAPPPFEFDEEAKRYYEEGRRRREQVSRGETFVIPLTGAKIAISGEREIGLIPHPQAYVHLIRIGFSRLLLTGLLEDEALSTQSLNLIRSKLAIQHDVASTFAATRDGYAEQTEKLFRAEGFALNHECLFPTILNNPEVVSLPHSTQWHLNEVEHELLGFFYAAGWAWDVSQICRFQAASKTTLGWRWTVDGPNLILLSDMDKKLGVFDERGIPPLLIDLAFNNYPWGLKLDEKGQIDLSSTPKLQRELAELNTAVDLFLPISCSCRKIA